jgi:glycosyltransferase involved in cell wall biosynthesis
MLSFYWKAMRRVRAIDPDVIHCFNLDAALPSILAAKLGKRKFVLDLCEPNYYGNWGKMYGPLHAFVSCLERGIARASDYLFVHNLFQVQKFRDCGVTSLEQIGSYPNRCDVVETVSVSDRTEDAVIGRIGSIYHNNGVEELVGAFKLLLEKYPRVRLLLAGKVAPKYQATLDSLVSPIREHVDLTGAFSFSDMPRLYGQTDISVMLYVRNEHFVNVTPTKFFDSMASGVPLVTSDIGGLRKIVEQHDCGVVVDETDTESVCAELERLILSPELRRTLAENGLRLAEEKYNWEAQEGRFLEIYDNL